MTEDILAQLSRDRLERMAEAGEEILGWYEALKKTDDNIVGEILRGQGDFYEYNHYPDGDVYDRETHAQYYYHAHRTGEHGHFHTFLRRKGMAPEWRPAPQSPADYLELEGNHATHLIAISMDSYGFPIKLFTTNRWVTAETLYGAPDVIRMLDRFKIGHVRPSFPVNAWIGAMLVLFRPQIERLLIQRDLAMRDWAAKRPDGDVYEDRELEICSEVEISTEAQIRAVAHALEKSAA